MSEENKKSVPIISQSDISVSQEMALNLVQRGLVDLKFVFGGKLASGEGTADRALTPFGKALADFIYAAEKEGFSVRKTIDELHKVSQECGSVIYELGK